MKSCLYLALLGIGIVLLVAGLAIGSCGIVMIEPEAFATFTPLPSRPTRAK